MIEIDGVPYQPTMFPDGTSQVWKVPEPLHGRRVTWWFEHEAELLHILQLDCLLNDYSAGSSSLLIPYLPYARQDKAISNTETWALRLLLSLLGRSNWNAIATCDVHSAVARQQLPSLQDLPAPVWPLETYAAVIYPDLGASQRYEMQGDVPIFVGEKVRDPDTGRITSYEIHGLPRGLTGKALVRDDICDGGATFLHLADAVRKVAPELQLDLYVTHGLFSQGLTALLARYRRIITTNSLDMRHRKSSEVQAAVAAGRLTILPLEFPACV